MAKSNGKLEEFLLEYNRLETLLKKSENLPDTVLDFENNLDDLDKKEKLKVCRILRNYCRHHEDYGSFIDCSDGMLTFITSLNKDIEKPFLHISDKTKRIPAVSDKDSLKTVTELFSKYKPPFIALVNQKGKASSDDTDGVISLEMLADMVAESGSLATKIGKVMTEKIKKCQPEFTVAAPDSLLECYQTGENIVVVKAGKYKGIVIW